MDHFSIATVDHFSIDIYNNTLILNTGNYGIFDVNAKRNNKSKQEYFSKHKVDKDYSFELHHIIPFSKASNKSDTFHIDDYKNLIYLRKEKHQEFTATGNKNVVFKYNKDKPDMIFLDFESGYIPVNINNDAKVNKHLLDNVMSYNEKLLKKFYYA